MRKHRITKIISMIIWVIPGLTLCGCSILSPNSISTYPASSKADQYFEQENWTEARFEYENYLMQFPRDAEARLKLGRTLLALGDLSGALDDFKAVIDTSNKFPPEVYYWAGRASHMLDQYSEAESFYRAYVKTVDHQYLNRVNYYMSQLGAARKAGSADTQYLVENTGSKVNSTMDEFRPILSLNVDERFYYSIHDPVNTPQGPIVAQRKPSMSTAEIRQGIWSHIGPMDQELSDRADYQLLDFSSDGQQVLFSAMSGENTTRIYEKNFDASESEVGTWDHPIYDPTQGDRDLFVLHDSAFLFSSNRMEGNGGYDLYVTYTRLDHWVVQNLGPEINSAYDEISPFLSNDGRELYFSSNSPKSIGGYDVFFSTFDDEMESWSGPQNLLPPLNSGMNEVGFRLSPDGRYALMSSDRSGGYGGLDIYQVHFDEPKISQTLVNNPQYFFHVRAYRSFHSYQVLDSDLAEKPIYSLPAIPYGERPVVLSPGIKEDLDRVLGYSRLYPHTRLLLRIFTDRDVQDQFAMYRPVLILKNILDYLQNAGLAPDRYEIRLYGNQYPRYSPRKAMDQPGLLPARASNQRLEFDLVNTENLPVRFGVPVIPDDEGASLSPYLLWQQETQNLYFRIKLVESDQLMKGKKYYEMKDLMVSISEPGERFVYYVGIFSELEEAKQARLRFHANGYGEAEIVAFMGSSRITDDQINPALIEEYPQLKEYIIYQK